MAHCSQGKITGFGVRQSLVPTPAQSSLITYVTLGISLTNSSHAVFTLEMSPESTHFPTSLPLTPSARHLLTSGLLKYIHNYFPGFCPFSPKIQIYLKPRLVFLCAKPSSGFFSYSEENPASSMDLQGTYHQVATPTPSYFCPHFQPLPHSLASSHTSLLGYGQVDRVKQCLEIWNKTHRGLPLSDCMTLRKLLNLMEPFFSSINEHSAPLLAGCL